MHVSRFCLESLSGHFELRSGCMARMGIDFEAQTPQSTNINASRNPTEGSCDEPPCPRRLPSADVLIGRVGALLLRVDAVLTVVVVTHNHNYTPPFYGEMVQIPTRENIKHRVAPPKKVVKHPVGPVEW